jgi:hypothetical protein
VKCINISFSYSDYCIQENMLLEVILYAENFLSETKFCKKNVTFAMLNAGMELN